MKYLVYLFDCFSQGVMNAFIAGALVCTAMIILVGPAWLVDYTGNEQWYYIYSIHAIVLLIIYGMDDL